MPTDFLSVLHEFHQRGIRYVLVGGLAVVLHGIDRLTADIDLVVDLAAEQAARAIAVLLELGFKSHAPVDPRQFADERVRDRWRLESGMLVLSFWDPENRRPTVDLFAHYPMDFQALFDDSIVLPLNNTAVRVASIDHLIDQARGRPPEGSRGCGAAGGPARRAGPMNRLPADLPPASFGGWSDAEELRKWSFLRRTSQQRLDWLTDALTVSLLARAAARGPLAWDDRTRHAADRTGPAVSAVDERT